MRNLHTALNNLKFDTRMIDWNIKNGLLKKADVDQHLNQLPDDTDRKDQVTLEDEDSPSHDE